MLCIFGSSNFCLTGIYAVKKLRIFSKCEIEPKNKKMKCFKG